MPVSMIKPAPSEHAMVPFASVNDMMQIINLLSVEKTLSELVSCIEEEVFRRWEQFQKIPRIASHPKDRVIECELRVTKVRR